MLPSKSRTLYLFIRSSQCINMRSFYFLFFFLLFLFRCIPMRNWNMHRHAYNNIQLVNSSGRSLGYFLCVHADSAINHSVWRRFLCFPFTLLSCANLIFFFLRYFLRAHSIHVMSILIDINFKICNKANCKRFFNLCQLI